LFCIGAATNTVRRLNNDTGNASGYQGLCCRKTCHTCTDDDDIRICLHDFLRSRNISLPVTSLRHNENMQPSAGPGWNWHAN
jgi:hypothetical protein